MKRKAYRWSYQYNTWLRTNTESPSPATTVAAAPSQGETTAELVPSSQEKTE